MTALPVQGTIRRALSIFIIIFAAGAVVSIAVAQTAYALALLSWIALILAERQPFPRIRYEWFFAAFIVLGAVSVLFAVRKGIWMPYLKRVALLPVVYLLAHAITGRKMVRAVLSGFVTVGVLFALVGIVKFLAGPDTRLRLFNHYMTSGGILMIVSLISFSAAFVPAPRPVRVISAICGAVVLVPLVMTFTRSSWLGLVAGLGLMCLLRARRLIPFLAAALVLLVVVAPPQVRERALSSFDPYHPSNIERTYMWKAGVEMMMDHPLTGTGDMDLSDLYREYRSPEAEQVHGHMHNNLVMFGAIMGIPGLLFFVAMSVFIF
ncbi:MAG TPA: O-antigen ligase family protein, partial [Candidatus Krumholzibacterium sp.]|nr:O-antigen ligase family protein [Candidatus Krumholzibacterium sp.]